MASKPRTWFVSGGILLLIAFAVQIGFPKLMHNKLIESKQLRKGSAIRKEWENSELDIHYKIYLFNVTNPDRILKGDKPVVQEIGPFIYKENKSKIIIEDDPKDDTSIYRLKNSWYFDQDATNEYLTGEELIVLPHLPILLAAQYLFERKHSFLKALSEAIPIIFKGTKDPFMITTVNKILFDGVSINCGEKQPTKAAVDFCFHLTTEMNQLLVREGNTTNEYKFSLFRNKNDTESDVSITIKRGVQSLQEVGKVVRINEESRLKYWSAQECNEINGLDTSVFPPFVLPHDIDLYDVEQCRTIKALYQEHKHYKGIYGPYFEVDLGDLSADSELKCFCPNTKSCPKRGAFEVTNCTGVPFIVTLPHCYNCDSEYVTNVDGLQPEREKHASFFLLEQKSGTPVSWERRLQYNIWLSKIPDVDITSSLPDHPVLFPIFWYEEGVHFNDHMMVVLKYPLYRAFKLEKICRMVLIGTAIVILFIGIKKHHRLSRQNEFLPKQDEQLDDNNIRDVNFEDKNYI